MLFHTAPGLSQSLNSFFKRFTVLCLGLVLLRPRGSDFTTKADTWIDNDLLDDVSEFDDAKYLGLGGAIHPDTIRRAR